MMDSRGQVSLEYLLILAISLILLLVFTLPLTELTIQNTMDVSDAMNMKSDLSKLSHAIKTVYGQGQGSRQSVNIVTKQSVKLNIDNDHASCNLKLKGGSSKTVKENYDSNLKKTSIPLGKGSNTIIVEWPVGSYNMRIYKK
ncbi:class III signal peptide-containing protein [uncultured Methanobrevibacter sp.]|uniref:class III signal peptide-containing protein n=1 Tax=uncultured Methanobrevibacter sp. TaxID=253161 RepID=UPI0025FC9998|nr:class III signal peptide-containing protein [uncultured Methanobrevibacter sp.]